MRKKKKSAQRNSLVIGICIFLIALVWLVFGQTLGHGFLNYDDDVYVSKNPLVASGITLNGLAWSFTHSHAFNWHPLTTISHMLDCQLFGLNASGHHFTNVFWHTLVAILLFLSLWQLTAELWRSAFVAAVFAIHPLRVESVAWIAERKDVLSGVFFMLTLLAYGRYVRGPTIGRYITMSILFALGLMSKPMLVTLPFVLLLLDYWPLKRFMLDRPSFVRLLVEKIPLFLLAAGSCVVTALIQSQQFNLFKDLPLSARIGNAFLSYITYIWQMFWPANLAAFYPFPPDAALPAWKIAFAIIFLLSVSAAAFALRRTRPYFITGWFWYVGMLVPVIGVFQVGLQGHADRYTYLPQIGLYVLVTWAIVDLTKSWRYRRYILATSAVIILAGLSSGAWAQTQFWRDDRMLWQHALAVTSHNYIAHNNLGAFLQQGDEARANLEEAVRLQPDYANAHHNLGLLLLDQGKLDDAIAHLQKTHSLDPRDANVCTDLGNAYLLKGEAREAIDYYERCLQLAPESPIALNNLAWIFSTCADDSLRDGTRAILLAEKAFEISLRQNAIFGRTLAAAYAETGRFNDAIEAAQQASQLAAAQNNSGLAGKLEADVDLYRTNLPLRDYSLTNAR